MTIEEGKLFDEIELRWECLPAPEPTSSWEYAELWHMARMLRLQVIRLIEKSGV